MQYIDVDTAVEVRVNLMPLLDSTDFVSIEDSIVYDAAGMDLVWNFQTTAGVTTKTAVTPTTGGGDYDWGNLGDGMYKIGIPASGGASINNNAEGYGWFTGVCNGVLAWRSPEYGFRAASTNDALIDATLVDEDDLGILIEDTVATVNSQTSFDMTSSIPNDDLYNGLLCVIYDASTAAKWSTWVTDIDQANDRILINAAAPFTVIAGDTIRVYREQHPQYALQAYDPPTRAELTTDRENIKNYVLDLVRLLVRSDAAIATDKSSILTDINSDEGSGAGDYDNTTDAVEALSTQGASVKTKTDQLNFGVANAVDANITNVAGGSDLTGSGTGNQEYGES